MGAQGPRNLTIMAPIMWNIYYAFRNMSAIMETAFRNRTTIKSLIMSKKPN